MDEKWFKQRQKTLRVTADQIADRVGKDRSVVSKILGGRLKMSVEWAQAFADALDVPLATVLEKAGVTDRPTAQELTPGFADSDVAPFAPKGMEERGTRTIADAFAAKPGVDIWRVKGDAMALVGYLQGDFLLVDTHASDRVKAGDAVIAQVYDRNGATTVLRVWQPPVLVCPKDQTVRVVDNNNVVIRGRVTASWRTA